jgi:hypothetical protein
MKLMGAVLGLGVLAGTAVALSITGSEAMRARAAAAQSRSELQQVTLHAAELQSFKTARPNLPPLPSPGSGMSTRITAVLASCGLPASTLANLSPDADSLVPLVDSPDRYVRRRIVLNLTEVTLPKLGAFLEAWRAAEPYWIPATIDVTPTTPKAGAPGGDLPLQVTLSLEALFLDESGGAR